MNDLIIAALTYIEAELMLVGLVFLRIGGIVAFIPVFGERSIPARVKLAIAAAFTVVVAPGLVIRIDLPETGFVDLVGFALIETGIGVFFGLILRFFVVALQIAGSVAAQSTSLSQIFGGSAGADPQPAIAHVLVVAGLALAAMMGFHVHVAKFMIHTYDLVPAGTPPNPSHVTMMGIAAVAQIFALGVALAGAYLVGSLVYNVTLGVINRAMPQLMVSFIGAPAITAGGLVVLVTAAPLMLSIWVSKLSDAVANPVALFP